MIVPDRRALWLLAGLSVLFLGAAVEPALLWAGLAADAVLLAAVVLEGLALRRAPVEVGRAWVQQLQINRPAELRVTLEHRGRGRVVVHVRQPWPRGMEAERETATLSLAGAERARLLLTATPRRRGPVHLPALEVDVRSRFGLARLRRRVTAGAEATVYPDLQRVSEYERLRRSRALRQAGFHRQRVVGHGRDFDQIREYLPGDDFRDVNWKATARLHRPITNLYQAERSREVMLCVDVGRMMGNPVGPVTTLDRAVDAALMLAHVARGQGDRVGLVLFRDVVETVVKPASDAATGQLILERLAAARCQPVFSSFNALVETLRRRQSHRSLVFIFTDLNDPQLASDLAALMPLLSKRHLVVVVSLHDAMLEQVAEGPAEETAQLYQVLAARQLADERARHVQELSRSGVQVLSVDAGHFDVEVVNRYMAIRSRQML